MNILRISLITNMLSVPQVRGFFAPLMNLRRSPIRAVASWGVAELLPSTTAGVLEAARRLARGDLVAFPTETVYGLGANAFLEKSVRQIFTVHRMPDLLTFLPAVIRHY
jgi:hypothetical protein